MEKFLSILLDLLMLPLDGLDPLFVHGLLDLVVRFVVGARQILKLAPIELYMRSPRLAKRVLEKLICGRQKA
jgi:hypothetical protein